MKCVALDKGNKSCRLFLLVGFCAEVYASILIYFCYVGRFLKQTSNRWIYDTMLLNQLRNVVTVFSCLRGCGLAWRSCCANNRTTP